MEQFDIFGSAEKEVKKKKVKKSQPKLKEVQKAEVSNKEKSEPIEKSSPKILSVTELTKSIRGILEGKYADVWIAGEVSNFKRPVSGHFYLTLKDEKSQVSAVMFRGVNQHLSFKIEDGLKLICHGRISVYEPRGSYQIIIDHCEPKGVGALQLAFEQLKKKLAEEGLFSRPKRRLPFLPQTVGVVTSQTGAAIRDIVKVISRRFEGVNVLLIPVKVQGQGAAQEVAAAINLFNKQKSADVLIVGRGGGSLEDLWAFNEEVVARAIFASEIPVVSAVGHEIDFTIADFVADLRAPTPSAAAEVVVPSQAELRANVAHLKKNLFQSVVKDFPQRTMQLDGCRERLEYVWNNSWEKKDDYLKRLISNLNHLSPLNILAKGYSVVSKKDADQLVTSAKELKAGDSLKIRFSEGKAGAKVTSIEK